MVYLLYIIDDLCVHHLKYMYTIFIIIVTFNYIIQRVLFYISGFFSLINLLWMYINFLQKNVKIHYGICTHWAATKK